MSIFFNLFKKVEKGDRRVLKNMTEIVKNRRFHTAKKQQKT